MKNHLLAQFKPLPLYLETIACDPLDNTLSGFVEVHKQGFFSSAAVLPEDWTYNDTWTIAF